MYQGGVAQYIDQEPQAPRKERTAADPRRRHRRPERNPAGDTVHHDENARRAAERDDGVDGVQHRRRDRAACGEVGTDSDRTNLESRPVATHMGGSTSQAGIRRPH